MDSLLYYVDVISNWIWGIPMLIILAGGSVVLTFYLGFFQFRNLGYILKETFGRMFSKQGEGKGTISAFQAAASALGATIGAGNITGVGIAIAYGGPGAVVWMWVVSMMACAYKYSEIVLGIKYRKTNERGEFFGGPMFYLNKALPYLGTIYGALFILELAPSVGNQTASAIDTAEVAGVPRMLSLVVIAAVILIIVYGGVKRVGSAMEKVVPFMGIIYIFASMAIIVINITHVPAAFATIFKSAFTGAAATGGFAGATVAQAMRWGLARGVGSNDAGNGQSALIHAAAVTDHPGRQGIWGVFEVIADTIIICSMSALVIVITGVYETVPAEGAATLAAMAFQQFLGAGIGGIVMTMVLTLFCLTTIIMLFFFGEKLADGLFGLKVGRFMKYFYMAFVFLGAYGGVGLMVRFLDIMYAAIIIPNVIGIFILRKEIKEICWDFFNGREKYDKIREDKEISG